MAKKTEKKKESVELTHVQKLSDRALDGQLKSSKLKAEGGDDKAKAYHADCVAEVEKRAKNPRSPFANKKDKEG